MLVARTLYVLLLCRVDLPILVLLVYQVLYGVSPAKKWPISKGLNHGPVLAFASLIRAYFVASAAVE